MKDFFKKHLIPLRQDLILFSLLALPAIIVYFIGLNQLNASSFLTLSLGLITKFITEFLVVATLFYFLHFIGIKRRWLLALFIFLYYTTICADCTILLYFKERLNIKYLMGLESAPFQILFNIRILFYLILLYALSHLSIKYLWQKTSFKQSTKKLATTAVLLLIITIFSPLKYFQTFDAFMGNSLIETPILNIASEFVAPKYKKQITNILPTNLQETAKTYGLFQPTNFVNQNTFDKIILITTDSLSNKFISVFNPQIPLEASYSYDSLLSYFPSASLKPITLSTFHGLSVIFSSHPNTELMLKNQFPISMVKELKNNGFKTMFFSGANVEHFNEYSTLQQVGFEEIYGASTFERNPEYSSYVSRKGLSDRKLFDFTIDYLKQNKENKLFINILNVDTHIPSGRKNYFDLEYPMEISSLDENIEKLYTKQGMPRAFARHNYDLSLFIKNLQDNNLLDDRTLVIITSTNPYYANTNTKNISQNWRPYYDEVPIMFLSQKEIIEPMDNSLLLSQLDIAPTILGLAGIKTPQGMFGRSIFDNQQHTIFTIKDTYVIVQNREGAKIVSLNSKKTENKNLLELLNTAITFKESK